MRLSYNRSRSTDGYYSKPPGYTTIPRDVHVTFYNNHYQRSTIVKLNKYTALENIFQAAHELFPFKGDYRLISERIGSRSELATSEQIMDTIEKLDHVLPQLSIRLEEVMPRSPHHSFRHNHKHHQQHHSHHRRNSDHYIRTIPITRTPSPYIPVPAAYNDPNHYVLNTDDVFVCNHCRYERRGTRYHCLECPDYDLCEGCERRQAHCHHALLRIVNPKVTQIPDYVTRNLPQHVFPENEYFLERARY